MAKDSILVNLKVGRSVVQVGSVGLKRADLTHWKALPDVPDGSGSIFRSCLEGFLRPQESVCFSRPRETSQMWEMDLTHAFSYLRGSHMDTDYFG